MHSQVVAMVNCVATLNGLNPHVRNHSAKTKPQCNNHMVIALALCYCTVVQGTNNFIIAEGQLV